jgi:hypothetical protein
MDSNAHSIQRPPRGRPDALASLAAAVDELAAQDLDRLPDAALADQVLELRRLVDRLEGHWLQQLAAVDGRGAAGAEQGLEVGAGADQGAPGTSTAAWLRRRLRLGAGAAAGCVRTARALFRGPLAGTAQALTGGAISVAHASVLAHGTQDLPEHLTWKSNRSCWRPLAGWTRPGFGGSWVTSSRWPTLRAPTGRPSVATSGGGCG